MCNKIKLSKDTAKEVIRQAVEARRGGDMTREEIRYYWCIECEAYHTTSKMWRDDDQS